MKNSEKLNSIIGTLLVQVDETVMKKETPSAETLEALRILVSLTSVSYRINGDRERDQESPVFSTKASMCIAILPIKQLFEYLPYRAHSSEQSTISFPELINGQNIIITSFRIELVSPNNLPFRHERGETCKYFLGRRVKSIGKIPNNMDQGTQGKPSIRSPVKA